MCGSGNILCDPKFLHEVYFAVNEVEKSIIDFSKTEEIIFRSYTKSRLEISGVIESQKQPPCAGFVCDGSSFLALKFLPNICLSNTLIIDCWIMLASARCDSSIPVPLV